MKLDDEAVEGAEMEPPDSAAAEGAGYTICVNCHADGTHDVYREPLRPASEQDYPDGMFGLDSMEDALKAVVALHRQDPAEEEDAVILREFGAPEE